MTVYIFALKSQFLTLIKSIFLKLNHKVFENFTSIVEKSFNLSFWLVCVLDVVSFPFKTTVNSVSANTRGTFFETSKSLGLTEIALYFFFMNLSSIKFNYRRSHFLTLLFDLKFMLLIDILNIDFFVFIGTLFIMRETGIS